MRIIQIITLSLVSLALSAQGHPRLTLTSDGVDMIRTECGKVTLFDKAVSEAQKEVDTEIELGEFVPMPKDMAGGYTYERNKRNFFILQKAGNLYQITQDEKYANDPNFNFRSDPVFNHRKNDSKTATGVNVIESHGTYDPISEIPIQPFSPIKNISILKDDSEYTIIDVHHKNGNSWILALAKKDNKEKTQHNLKVEGKEIS